MAFRDASLLFEEMEKKIGWKYKVKTNNGIVESPVLAWDAFYVHCAIACAIAQYYNFAAVAQLGTIKEMRSGIKVGVESAMNTKGKKIEFFNDAGFCVEDMEANRVGAIGGVLIRKEKFKGDCEEWCVSRGYNKVRLRENEILIRGFLNKTTQKVREVLRKCK